MTQLTSARGRRATHGRRQAITARRALLAIALASCGYKGDLVQAEKSQDEKAGQVEPEPVPEAGD